MQHYEAGQIGDCTGTMHLVTLFLLPSSNANIDVGAVRWDAWYGKPGQPIWENKYTGIVGKTVTSDIADPRFHYRLPFFATVSGNNTKNVSVTCDGNSTEGVYLERSLVAFS